MVTFSFLLFINFFSTRRQRTFFYAFNIWHHPSLSMETFSCPFSSIVRMAEWSKAPDSRSCDLAYHTVKWVFWSTNVGVGSNPTPDTYFFSMPQSCVLQNIQQLLTHLGSWICAIHYFKQKTVWSPRRGIEPRSPA